MEFHHPDFFTLVRLVRFVWIWLWRITKSQSLRRGFSIFSSNFKSRLGSLIEWSIRTRINIVAVPTSSTFWRFSNSSLDLVFSLLFWHSSSIHSDNMFLLFCLNWSFFCSMHCLMVGETWCEASSVCWTGGDLESALSHHQWKKSCSKGILSHTVYSCEHCIILFFLLYDILNFMEFWNLSYLVLVSWIICS